MRSGRQRGEAGGGYGSREVVALTAVATEFVQQIGVEGRLDAFGDGGEFEAAGEVDDGTYEGGAAGVGVVGRHQGAVDLEDVDR